MENEKILEIWHTFDAENTKNVFYSIINENNSMLPVNLKNVYLFGKVYRNDSGEPYVEVANNILSELLVPEPLGTDHQKNCNNMTTYRVSVFLINGRLFVVKGYDKDGKTVADDMEGYQRLFTATYSGISRKWMIPVSDILNAFDCESPISTGVDRDLGNHIEKLYKLFGW